MIHLVDRKIRLRSLLPVLAGFAALGAGACGSSTADGMNPITPDDGGDSDGGGGSGDGGGGGRGGPTSPWTELAGPMLNVEGGKALSPGGLGHAGGPIGMFSSGGLAIGPASSDALPAPEVPAVPGDATRISADALGADISAAGSVHLDGKLRASGGDAVRTITSTGGDIFVTGELDTADLGAEMQGLKLEAPSGAVFVSGAVVTSGRGAGQAGGAITIVARRVIVTGKLASAGGAGAGGGAVSITATDSMALAGAVDSFGGDAHAAEAAAGGPGGAVVLQAAGDLDLAGTVRLRGGAAVSAGASATGGPAGALSIACGRALRVAGTVDARGGVARATSAGGQVAGGAAGAIQIGDATRRPTSIAIFTDLVLLGGDGDAAGGNGGPLVLEAHGGDLSLAGSIDVGGGDGAALAGAAGTVNGTAGSSAGGIRLSGRIAGNGGSVTPAGAGDGGQGATVLLMVTSVAGGITVDPGAEIAVDGGAAGGPGRAGGGGKIDLLSRDGDISMAGSIQARGGAAPDPGGAGGLGGAVNLFSDDNHNGVGGNLTVQPEGVIDVSGGPGTVGGHARNNGGAGVALFPDMMEQIAVLLNSDGIHGSPQDGQLVNLGIIRARGGAAGGWGGDIVYHGRQPGNDEDPVSGQIDNAADGDGMSGAYAGE